MVLKDKKTKITFHSGVLTIGGTIIEVAYEDSHIFFDFGSEYNPAAKVNPTDLQGLLDEKLVPFLDNMFDPKIPLKGYKSKENNFKNTAVFLSHIHLDHSKIVNYLNSEVPLYTLEGTKSLLNTLNINNDFLFPLYESNGIKNTRNVNGVKENEVVQVGKIKVKVMPVDHDAYGACGLFIETPDLTIAYTGDIRLHGYRKNDTLNFCKESENCDVLLIEGVSVSFQDFGDDLRVGEPANEPELIDKINKIVNDNKGKQITFNYYIANVERILNILKTNPRTVVLDSYSAYVVKEAAGYEAHYYDLDNKEYGLNPELKVDFEELLNDTDKYFWQLGNLALKYQDKLKEGGVYIHCDAQPLGEFDPTFKPFIKSFEDRNIEFNRVVCSGHARPYDLIEIINLIKPKLLAPIHSYHPEKLYNENGDMILVEKGQTI
ncbi:Predicted metal-dependent RNase%2C consists of a metallo-beta-lactamase domain and an RNA-binding KH domain [uncultured Clostridium sp.]|uniref:MBL fold metallo-hydrolase n=1 Tax=uncultured Clostridium sp. TaxID=59620 RepID=UPI0008218A62|nr:MBL fold metallo-hydrolase [uncultured Clostridium sp.]SCJ05204.1 Predicted metal-dependent RNase%2C consists of a metallo-beta-lactamase domain and an RNA-binding KH domain [uncultured Clostridium sp.]